jgi:hypothetical protein
MPWRPCDLRRSKSLESGDLSVDKAVIPWMSDIYFDTTYYIPLIKKIDLTTAWVDFIIGFLIISSASEWGAKITISKKGEHHEVFACAGRDRAGHRRQFRPRDGACF